MGKIACDVLLASELREWHYGAYVCVIAANTIDSKCSTQQGLQQATSRINVIGVFKGLGFMNPKDATPRASHPFVAPDALPKQLSMAAFLRK